MQVWLALCFCLLLVISSRSLAQEDPDDWDLSVKLVKPRVPASENRRLYVSSVIDMGIRACVCGSLNINTTGHRFSYSVDATCPGHGSQRSDEHGAVDDQGCAETWADQCRNACPREVFHCFTAAVDSFHMHHCEGRKMNVSVDIEISPADCEPNGNHSCPSRHFGTSVLVQVTGDELTQTYLVLSLISALACLLVIGLHIRYTELRRFPNDIVFWRTVCDLGFAAQFIWVNSLTLDNANRTAMCNPFIAMFTQFSIFGSLAWYSVLSLNTYLSIHNPFRKPSSYMKRYHAAVWSLSALTAFVVGSRGKYRPDFQICWVEKMEDSINILNWVCFFAWMIIFMFQGIMILVYQHLKLRQRGLKETLRKRQEILRQSRVYVLVFTAYWIVAGLIWFLVFLDTKDNEDDVIQRRRLAFIFAALTSLTGLMGCICWLALQRVQVVRLVLGPHHYLAKFLLTAEERSWAEGQERLEKWLQEGSQNLLHFDLVAPGPGKTVNGASLRAGDPQAASRTRDVELLEGLKFLRDHQFDDISAALRQEFITAVSEGIRDTSKFMFRRRRRRAPRRRTRTHSSHHPRPVAKEGFRPPAPTTPAPRDTVISWLQLSRFTQSEQSNSGPVMDAGSYHPPLVQRSEDSDDEDSDSDSEFEPESPEDECIRPEDGEEHPTVFEYSDALSPEDGTLGDPSVVTETNTAAVSIPVRGRSGTLSEYVSSTRHFGAEPTDSSPPNDMKSPLLSWDSSLPDAFSDRGLETATQNYSINNPTGSSWDVSAHDRGGPGRANSASGAQEEEFVAEIDAPVAVKLYHTPKRLPTQIGPTLKISSGTHVFQSYAPRIFRYLQSRVFGVSTEEYVASMGGRPQEMLKNFSEGASGSFLWTSADKVFRPKTITKSEHKVLLRMLPYYAKHMENHPNSLIVNIHGLYSIRMYSHTEYVMVMANALRQRTPEMPDYRIHEVYDLKGSWINRHAKPDKSGHISVFKDNDFKGVIQVGALRARELRRQLRQDSHFLMQMGIMDYSLLLGVHNCYEPRIPGAHCNALQRKPGLNSPRLGGSLDPRNPGTLGPVDEEKLDPVEKAAEPRPHSSSVFNPIQEGHPAAVVYGPGIYHLALIDILQEWTLTKRLEHWLKRIIKCQSWEGMSAVEPVHYQQRFTQMIDRILTQPEFAHM